MLQSDGPPLLVELHLDDVIRLGDVAPPGFRGASEGDSRVLSRLVRKPHILNSDAAVLTGWKTDRKARAGAAVGEFDEVDDAAGNREYSVLKA